MKKIFFLGLVIFTFNSAHSFSDEYLYMIGETPVRRSQLKNTSKLLVIMSCAYQKSLLPDIFNHLKNPKSEAKEFIPLFRLLEYARTYKVKAPEGVLELFNKSIKKNHCTPLNGSEEGSLFKRLVELETFLRSRYIFGNDKREIQNFKRRGFPHLLKALEEQVPLKEFSEK